MAIKNDTGTVYADMAGEDATRTLDTGWMSAAVTLSITIGDEATLGIELTKKELKALKKEIKIVLDEWSE